MTTETIDTELPQWTGPSQEIELAEDLRLRLSPAVICKCRLPRWLRWIVGRLVARYLSMGLVVVERRTAPKPPAAAAGGYRLVSLAPGEAHEYEEPGHAGPVRVKVAVPTMPELMRRDPAFGASLARTVRRAVIGAGMMPSPN